MVSAWYMKDDIINQKDENKRQPNIDITLEKLKDATGVLYYKLDETNYESALNEIKTNRGYTYNDLIEISPEKLPNYDAKVKMFFEEHLHTDEEIRFILAGSGYFDVRDNQDQWIRIKVVSGDLLILPAGIYHRFTLDTKDYIKAMRLFVGEPVWTPHNRPADAMEARKEYVKWQSSIKIA